jgi:uncharacterized protein (PEP-CTERM system associated)
MSAAPLPLSRAMPRPALEAARLVLRPVPAALSLLLASWGAHGQERSRPEPPQPEPPAVVLPSEGATPNPSLLVPLKPGAAVQQAEPAAAAGPAPRRTWETKVAVEASLTATDNGNLASGDARNEDLIATLRPSLRVARRGPNFGVDAQLGMELVEYANGSQANRALPAARVAADATIIERILSLEAAADVRQSASDVYLGSAGAVPGSNTSTVSTVSISPVMEYELSPRVSLVARADESFTQSTQDDTGDLRSHRALVRLSQKPLPFGAGIELSRQLSRYDNGDTDSLSSTALRVNASYAIEDQLLLGVIAGAERNALRGEHESDSIVGLQLQWVPGPRSNLQAKVEKRFFGTGWELALRHRTPFLSMGLNLSREPVGASPTSTVAPDNDLTRYLDAILTARYPDPLDRRDQVESLVASRNLRTQLPSAVSAPADYAQLFTRASATVVWLTPRQAVSLSAYVQTLRRLGSLGTAAEPLVAEADSRQSAIALEASHRLTPLTSVAASMAWGRVEGLGSRTGDETREATYRLALSSSLSPRSGVSFGLQYRQLSTNVVSLNSYHQSSLFAALDYRF